MITAAAAAKILGLKKLSVLQLVRRGKIKATWNDAMGRYEIEEAEVDRYSKERLPAHRPTKKKPVGATGV